MFRRPTKKRLLIRRVITYSVMVFSVFVIVSGVILFVLGYRIDGDKGRLEQGALVQFDSQPAGADVLIDGKSIKANTPAKQTVVAGLHSFVVQRDNYRPWSKTLSVKAGTLQWFDYIRLVPKDLKVESVANYASVSGQKASPDNKWLLIQEKAESPTFQLVDLRSQQIKSSVIVLPTDLYKDATTEGVSHVFTMESWDSDGRHIIVKHETAGVSEYIVLDTQDVASSSNVSARLGISLSQLQFAGTSGNVLYGLSEGTIRELDVSNSTISRVLVPNATSFDVIESNIVVYNGVDPLKPGSQVVGVYRDGDELPRVLRTANDSTIQLKIDATRYYNDDVVAISEGLQVTVYKGRFPTSSSTDNSSLRLYGQFSVKEAVERLSFSDGGDRLVAQSGLTFSSYEIEYKRQTDSVVATSEMTSHPLKWLDEAYVWAVYDGHLSIREFDGANLHVIMKLEPGFDATLSQNGKYIYGIAKSGDTYQLQRAVMILN